MISLRRANQRHHVRRGRQGGCLPPGAAVEGSVAQEDTQGRSGLICAGAFQRPTSGRGVRRSATNASRTEGAHIFEMYLRPSQPGIDAGHEQKRFCAAERRGLLCVVASPAGRRGCLRVHQDARIYSAMRDPGQHVVHELSQERSAWLHVVRGGARLEDVVLTTGDGLGVTAARAVSLTALEETEILLIDLGEPLVRSLDQGGVQ